MKAHGYTTDNLEAEIPSELTEVTFTGKPDELRKIAAFLILAADEIETMTDFNHVHLSSKDKSWSDDFVDVIVCKEP